jgi:hypothetical protein
VVDDESRQLLHGRNYIVTYELMFPMTKTKSTCMIDAVLRFPITYSVLSSFLMRDFHLAHENGAFEFVSQALSITESHIIPQLYLVLEIKNAPVEIMYVYYVHKNTRDQSLGGVVK